MVMDLVVVVLEDLFVVEVEHLKVYQQILVL